MEACDGINFGGFDIDSFLMVGQSNMCGRGHVDEVAPIDNKDCYMLRMGRWQKMREPVNVDRPVRGAKYTSGVTLAASFADEYAKTYQRKVGLIPCADGGTKASQWLPGDLLFDHAVMQTGLARRTSNLRGILWHQGESDCKKCNCEKYFNEVVYIMKSFRKSFGMPTLPIIMGELSHEITAEGWVENEHTIDDMNNTIHRISEEIGNCSVVSVDGLGLQSDGLHFSAVSCRELGLRYFEEYRKIQ